MSGINSILNIAKGALAVNQAGLQVTAHNIANVNTKGYSRQETVQEAAVPVPTEVGLLGNGVDVKEVARYYDKYLDRTITEQNNALVEQQTLAGGFQQLEGILNEDNSKLSKSITDFYNSWQDLTADPTSVAVRDEVTAAGQNLTGVVRDAYTALKQLQLQQDQGVKQQVDDINTLTSSIADLNNRIFQGKTGTSEANDYIDQRTQLLNDLSGKLDIVSFEDNYGRVTVLTGKGKALVDQGQSYQLGAQPDPSSGFYRVNWLDSTGEATDITDDINGGSLKATIDMRDVHIPGFINNLDGMAKSITQNVNYFHKQGYNLYGQTGTPFFKELTGNYAANFDITDAIKADNRNIAATSDPNSPTNNDIALKIAAMGQNEVVFPQAVTANFAHADQPLGLSGSLVVNGGAINIAATDTLQDIRDNINALGTGVSASISAETGGGYTLLIEPDGSGSSVTLMDGSLGGSSTTILQSLGIKSGGSSYSDYISSEMGKIGQLSKNAQDLSQHRSDAMQTLQAQRGAVSGVSLDEEMTNMIKYQYAYQASARLVTTADDMLKTLLSAVGVA